MGHSGNIPSIPKDTVRVRNDRVIRLKEELNLILELVEDGSVTSASTTLVNLRAGYNWIDFPWGDLAFTLDVFNLFDSVDDDITYFYASRLPGEPEEGVEDQHFHPVEPRMLRGSITWRY
jgi:hypothetical protein